MLKEITFCSYYEGETKTQLEISSQNGMAVISQSDGILTKKRTADINYLRNLDIFFIDSEPELWGNNDISDEATDILTIEIENVKHTLYRTPSLSEKNKQLMSDIRKYLRVCFDCPPSPKTISCHSFEGGGPEYQFQTVVKGIFTWYSQRQYAKADHERLCGAGYDAIFSLYPLRTGTGTAILTGSSPICPTETLKITVDVDDQLNLQYKTEPYYESN